MIILIMKTLSKKMRRAVFFDRDGVLNRKPPRHDYVKTHDEFFWSTGAMELIKKINTLGFLVVVISNQRGIARGLMTAGFVEELHARMNRELTEIGARIDAFYYCPHDYDDKCACRKPKPGLFIRAKEEWGIDLSKSFSVGDRVADTEAALSVGCIPIDMPTDRLDTATVLEIVSKRVN